ncbi:predicted protein [Nematostella vectensis]|uniref:G-protein coupled receptors family 1 profile domain-containing protein n=1 Tax=Nematostella vectensis TaxID=45351 RepID=A7SKL7_NEMVE|nr:predicted protein [Nematostella vectensis]|eukprot:XP_001647516.1 predicted protein [Nematostella vectensis]
MQENNRKFLLYEKVIFHMLSGVLLIIGVMLAITTLVGVLSNLAVCLAVWWNKKLRSQLSLFLVCLAVSDIGMSTSCMPFAVAIVVFRTQNIDAIFCYFNGFINSLFSLASILTICSISIFQYVSVVLPLEKQLTNFRCLVMVISVWIISGFLAMGPMMHWGRYDFTSNIFNCEFYNSSQKAQISYNITLSFAGFVFPLGLIAFSYISIYRTLRTHKSSIERTSAISSPPTQGASISVTTKIATTIGLIIATFLVCRTPFFVYLLLTVKASDYSFDFLGQLSFWAVYLHSACNPFIFAFKQAEYQETLTEIYQGCCLVLREGCCGNTKDKKKVKSTT